MPVAVISRSTAAKSQKGEFVVPFFAPDGAEGFTVSNPYWYMESGWESIGATEDEMTFRIQATAVSNYAFDTALNPNGPLGQIKFDTPVVAARFYTDTSGTTNYEIVWGGFVKSIRQVSEHGQQYCQITATSIKKLLRDINIRGSYCWDGSNVVYRDGIPLHMNKGGRPDWTFTDDGIPMMAVNPDWSLDTDQEPPDPSKQDSTAATYCTLGMLLQYLITFYSGATSESSQCEDARNLARQFFTGLDCLPNTFPFMIQWPDTFGQELDQNIIANFNNATGQNNTSQGGARKGRDLAFRNGQPLISNPGEIGVLDTIFAECGAYSYSFSYGDLGLDSDSGAIVVNLNCIPTRLIAANQAQSIFYAGGKESAIGPFPLVREFDYVESCSGTYTRLNGIGSTIKIETRVDSSGDPLDGSSSTTGIKYGFTPADFNNWRALSVSLGGGQADEQTMHAALGNFPHLFSRFLIEPSYDFTQGTDFSDYPLAKAPRPVWPFLLSYQGAGLSQFANDIVPYPIRIEIDTGDGNGFRDSGVEADGFISWDNGYFEFNALREIGINRSDTPDQSSRYGMFTWGPGGWGSVVGGVLDCTLNDIRVTIAIPHDATLNYSSKTPADGEIKSDEGLYVNAPDSPDAQRFDSRFTRTMIVDLHKLYDLWLRVGSFPIPESIGGAQFPDAPGIGDAVRDNYDLLVANVQKSLYERNRLQRSGYFRFIGSIVPPEVYPLGVQLDEIAPYDQASGVDPFPLNCCIQRRVWATRNLGSPDAPKWTSTTEIYPI
jgi:hypothetical protein